MSNITIRRQLQLTDLKAGKNAVWEIEYDQDANKATVRSGRVGEMLREKTYFDRMPGDIVEMIDKMREKGYVEKALHRPPVIKVAKGETDPKLAQLAQWIKDQAQEGIRQYLAVPVSQLSIKQIRKARELLNRMMFTLSPSMIEDYYKLIPTKVPRGWSLEKVAVNFDRDEQIERLNQLEANLETITAEVDGLGTSAEIGAKVRWIDPSSTTFDQYRKLAASIQIQDAFEVEIEHERQRYERCAVGNQMLLFHGTRNSNLQHILRQGLKLSKANGGRFGSGIYTSPAATRSVQYAHSTVGIPQMLLVCEGRVGTPLTRDDSHTYSQPPQGYDSLWGTRNRSGLGDEIVFYSEDRVTIKALLTVKQ